jgi:hypothetical protein
MGCARCRSRARDLLRGRQRRGEGCASKRGGTYNLGGSFHVKSVISDPDGRHVGELDYVAPDRFRMRGFGEGASTTIRIGQDTFFSFPEDLNRFSLYRDPCDFGVGGFLPALEVVGLAEHVDRDGGTYRFSVDGEGNPDGEVRIEDGYIVSLVFRYDLAMLGNVEERHTLSDFDSDIRIEPPPASQIEEDGPRTAGSSSWTRGRLRTARPSGSHLARSPVPLPGGGWRTVSSMTVERSVAEPGSSGEATGGPS